MWDFFRRLRELRQMHDELERRVAERTAELTRANAALQAEIAVREQFEQALASAREWFEVTLASIGDAVIVADTEGRITFLNQVARDLTGRHGDVRGFPAERVFQIVHETSGEPVESPVARVLATGEMTGLSAQTLLIAANGQRRPIDNSAAPIRNAQGQLLGVVLVFRDVSEQRKAAAALREADRRKNRFLAILGHELRNPLSGIVGAIQVLARTGADDPEAGEMRQIIERQTGHMARMIDDLLEVSRISQGKIQIRPEPLDLTALLRHTARDLGPVFTRAGLALALELPEQPVAVSGDPTRLGQVFANLLQNAAKFTNSGGRVTIALHADTDEQMALARIRDTGIGMTAETLAQIFEPFSQADSSLDRSHGGLGLGLALVKGLVELHGGRIAAASAGAGCGTEFTIRLPLLPADALLRGDAPPPVCPVGPLRILIIDDQRDASFPMRRLLELDGHEVDVARDGPTGVERARSLQPHVVLCDIGLPGKMNGYAVAQALRTDALTQAARLVAVTGYGQEEDRQSALQAGFDRHLTKPVGLVDLRRLLAEFAPPV